MGGRVVTILDFRWCLRTRSNFYSNSSSSHVNLGLGCWLRPGLAVKGFAIYRTLSSAYSTPKLRECKGLCSLQSCNTFTSSPSPTDHVTDVCASHLQYWYCDTMINAADVVIAQTPARQAANSLAATLYRQELTEDQMVKLI